MSTAISASLFAQAVTKDTACSDHCEACDSGSSCQRCAAGYYVNEGYCRLQCPSNCTSCVTSTICAVCQTGFFLTLKGQCIGCTVDFCQSCAAAHSCQKCQNGYYAYSGACKPCVSNCQTCLQDSGCTNCFADFMYSESYGVCISSASCNYDTCKTCDLKSNYTMCGLCNKGYVLQNGNCLKCPSNCLQCASSQECSVCKSQYFLDSLTKSCIAWNCRQQVCKTCLNNSVCETCQRKFIKQGDTCVLQPILTPEITFLLIAGATVIAISAAVSKARTSPSSRASLNIGYSVMQSASPHVQLKESVVVQVLAVMPDEEESMAAGWYRYNKGQELRMNECVICLKRQSNLQTHCGHLFHEKCLLDWEKRSQDCPICRRNFQPVKIICDCHSYYKTYNLAERVQGQNEMCLRCSRILNG